MVGQSKNERIYIIDIPIYNTQNPFQHKQKCSFPLYRKHTQKNQRRISCMLNQNYI